mmetsp:Transcript_105123/g.296052  ORF Transcript_105123/g.296052 Transcript_105123/m.296052 type:complete len:369 (-) Transcript_105123:233-1339(-)
MAIQVEALGTAPSTPFGWQAVWDASAQRYYFFHTESGTSQWDPPDTDVTGTTVHGALLEDWQEIRTQVSALDAVAAVSLPRLAQEWEAIWEPSAARYYYWNSEKNISQWELPAFDGGVGPLDIEELWLGSDNFNPADPDVLAQLTASLRIDSKSAFEKLTGFQGGLNAGVWTLSASSITERKDFVLKLVRGERFVPQLPTEAESFVKLAIDYPGIASDPNLSFPVKLFACVRPDGTKLQDLIVMRRMQGERLAEVIGRKWYGNEHDQLWRVFAHVGSLLADFHRRYGNVQHGDLQPCNIFWDERASMASFIDIGGMGAKTADNDFEHFSKSVRLMTAAYGPHFESSALQAFASGYATAGGEVCTKEAR